MRVAEKRMRIAALQYANGQVNHCDELIDSSQCFSRILKHILRVYKSYHTQNLHWLSFINSHPKPQTALISITAPVTLHLDAFIF